MQGKVVGGFIGATLISLLLSLLIRWLLDQWLRINKGGSSTLACLLACGMSLGVAYPTMGEDSLLFYPVAAVVVWIFLFFELPLFQRPRDDEQQDKAAED